MPTLDRPAIANSKRSGSGHWANVAALFSNSAETTRQPLLFDPTTTR